MTSAHAPSTDPSTDPSIDPSNDLIDVERPDAGADRREEDAGLALDRQTLAIVCVLALAAFMSVLDGTIVTVAVDTFASVFDSPISTVVWVSVGYLLAAGLALPTSGWAIDRFGGRRVFFIGLGLFVLGSGLASLAWSAPSLIMFRVLQGFGGGMLEPTSLTLAAKAAGQRRVGRVMGILSLIINVAPVLGPLTGGLFATEAHWRWIFLINLPIGLIVAIAAAFVLPVVGGDREVARSDLRGLFLLSPGFVAILFAIDRLGGHGAAWTVVLPAAIGVALIGSYVRRALRVDAPVINVRLLARREFSASVGLMAVVGFVMYSQLISLPLFLHRVHGYTGVRQGLLTTALGVGLLISMSYASRRSDITGPRQLVGVGALMTAAGLLVFALAGRSMPVPLLMGVFVFVGLGFGAVAAPTFSSVYRTVPVEATSQATTTMFIVVQVFASIGITVIGLVLSDETTSAFGPLFTVLAGAAALAAVLSRRLPGAPAPAGSA